MLPILNYTLFHLNAVALSFQKKLRKRRERGMEGGAERWKEEGRKRRRGKEKEGGTGREG